MSHKMGEQDPVTELSPFSSQGAVPTGPFGDIQDGGPSGAPRSGNSTPLFCDFERVGTLWVGEEEWGDALWIRR